MSDVKICQSCKYVSPSLINLLSLLTECIRWISGLRTDHQGDVGNAMISDTIYLGLGRPENLNVLALVLPNLRWTWEVLPRSKDLLMYLYVNAGMMWSL